MDSSNAQKKARAWLEESRRISVYDPESKPTEIDENSKELIRAVISKTDLATEEVTIESMKRLSEENPEAFAKLREIIKLSKETSAKKTVDLGEESLEKLELENPAMLEALNKAVATHLTMRQVEVVLETTGDTASETIKNAYQYLLLKDFDAKQTALRFGKESLEKLSSENPDMIKALKLAASILRSFDFVSKTIIRAGGEVSETIKNAYYYLLLEKDGVV